MMECGVSGVKFVSGMGVVRMAMRREIGFGGLGRAGQGRAGRASKQGRGRGAGAGGQRWRMVQWYKCYLGIGGEELQQTSREGRPSSAGAIAIINVQCSEVACANMYARNALTVLKQG